MNDRVIKEYNQGYIVDIKVKVIENQLINISGNLLFQLIDLKHFISLLIYQVQVMFNAVMKRILILIPHVKFLLRLLKQVFLILNLIFVKKYFRRKCRNYPNYLIILENKYYKNLESLRLLPTR